MKFEHSKELKHNKINAETAKISWRELQGHFASGAAIYVAPSMDLVEVALKISKNDTGAVKAWMEKGLLAPVNDQQAAAWVESDATMWSVVIKPWVLVQNS